MMSRRSAPRIRCATASHRDARKARNRAAISGLLTFVNVSQRRCGSLAVIGFIQGIIEPDCIAATSDRPQI
jgi:hypothetical protein